MITPELLGYIRGELAKGRTRAEINGSLLAGGGWMEDDLSEAFREIVPMQANTILKAEPTMVSTSNTTPAHISIVPPMSSSKPFVSSVIPPPNTVASRMSSVFPNTPVIPLQTPAPSFSAVPPTTITPPVMPITPPPVIPPSVTPPPPSFVSPVVSPIASPVVPTPVQPPVVPKQFSTPPPAYIPPTPTPTFSSSPLKQPVLPNPPPPPPPHTFSVWKLVIGLVIIVLLGLVAWFFRASINDLVISIMGMIFKF